MAPEILCGEAYSVRADVYSFGVVLWEVLHRSRPFADANRWACELRLFVRRVTYLHVNAC
jgi:hypothetical protein